MRKPREDEGRTGGPVDSSLRGACSDRRPKRRRNHRGKECMRRRMHDALNCECSECGSRAQRRAVTGPWYFEETKRDNDRHEWRKGPQRGFHRERVP